MEPTPRTDWREHLRDAADLALVGIAVTVCAIPLVTAGSALATASAAIRHHREHGAYPALRTLAGDFARGIPAGAAALAVFLGVEALLFVNLRVAAGGTLPGGKAVAAVTAGFAVAFAGFALLTVAVHDGRWRDAIRASARIATTSWWSLPTVIAAAGIAAAIGALVPATAVLLPGFVLFAVQAIAVRGRRSPTSVPAPRSREATVHGGGSAG